MASLCVVGAPALTNASHKVSISELDDEDNRLNDTTATTSDTEIRHSRGLADVHSWGPKGLTGVLRHVGLAEGNDAEIAQDSLCNPMDDEISQEIRSLQRQLETCVRETNETKRKLWRIMDEYGWYAKIAKWCNALTCVCCFGRTKPLLSQRKEEEETTIKEYITMWRTKKVSLVSCNRLDAGSTLTLGFVPGACTEKETPSEEASAATRCGNFSSILQAAVVM